MNPIAIFYHCLFVVGEEATPLPAAEGIVGEQMQLLKKTGLLDQASYFLVGINGWSESVLYVDTLIPSKAVRKFHGLKYRNENATIRNIEEWLPGHDDWYVLYFHSKGATHKSGDDFTRIWRDCMTRHAILNWRQCVKDLDDGYDTVGSHWMEPPETPEGQYIYAGTFWWAKASYLLTLPSIMDRDRIKLSGLESIDSRYEAEVWLGNGPHHPKVMDYHPNWNPSKIETCKQ